MRMRRLKLIAFLVLFFALFINLNCRCEADLILVNGHIFTVEKSQPWAQACAVKNGRFTALGDNNFIKKFQGKNTRVIELNQRLVVPGFNDAHVHFLDGGMYLLGINLRGAADENEFKKRIQNYTGKLGKGEWILGGYWDHEAWPSKKHPTKELIDEITGDNPVFIYRLDGHIALANSLALKLSGITADTLDPQGGEIVKDPKTNEPTGILKDIAQNLVKNVIPPPGKDHLEKAIKKALAHANSLGLTSIQDNTPARIFELYQELLEKNQLTLRINAWRNIDFSENFEKIGIVSNFGSDMLRLGTIKIFVDGSMGAGTALFNDPYSDDRTTAGIPIYPEETLYSLVKSVDKAGLQVAAHAIGDKANTWILNAFERAFGENGKREARHRVEHAQVVLPEDLRRFRELGIIASIQPSHCIDDMRWAEKRIGKRVKNSYLFNSFVKARVKVAFGTDWPVESLDPMLTLYAAVTREFPEGGPEGGWFPREKITLEQAIEFYTLGAAYAEFQEKNKGSVKIGKLADLVVLDKNLFKIPAKEILNTKVDLTILGGKLVYRRKQ
jgi:predicted amidohydrolase YtcJ